MSSVQSLYDDTDTPTVAAADDSAAVELGTAFSTDTDGQITGVEFYKNAANTGTHPVSLWSASGERLATATASAESTQGWQVVSFDKPVTVTAGTTYVVSYRAPQGHYSYTAGAFAAATDRTPLHTAAGAGRYSYGSGAPTGTSNASYYVDPVFTVSAATPPSVSAVTPTNKTTSTPVNTAVTVTFAGTVQAGSAQVGLKDAAGNAVAGSLTNPAGTTASFTPAAALAAGQTYTVTVTGAKNLGGAAMTDGFSSTFTTADASTCPCTLMASSAKPTVSDAGDAGAITVGTRFTSSVDGYVTGLRYWRDAASTGTHTGALYTADGQRLASVTFADSGPGWQNAAFDTPVAVTADTGYVVAAYLPNGHYAATSNLFASPYANLPLTGTQGVFTSGADTFPTSTYGNTYYWVDPVFALSNDTTAPAISNLKATAADGRATITWTTDEASSSTVAYGLDKPATAATDTDAVTSHSVALSGLTTGKTYSYTVTSADAAGNATTSDTATFTVADQTAPVISAVVANSSGGSATITWTTDEAATGKLEYGTSASSLTSSASESGTGTSHSIKISGLTVGTTYSYRVTSADPSGNATSSPARTAAPASWVQQPIVTVTKVNNADAGPVYSGIWKTSTGRGYGDYNDDVSYTSYNGAYVSYTFTGIGVQLLGETYSDQGTVSVSIDGGTAKTVDTSGSTRKAQQVIFDSGTLTNARHTVKVTKTSGTTMTVDAFAVSSIDTTAPTISAVAASGSGSTGTVTWTTNEAATTLVSYGTSAGALTSTATGTDNVTGHTVNLTGLKAGTTYVYKVTSVDASGNATTSAAGSFAPVVPPKTVNDDDASVVYSGTLGTTWKRSDNRGYGDYGDDVTTTATNNAYATFTFTGTAVNLITEKSADQGYVQISVDGGAAKLVYLYSASRQVQQNVFSATGLSAGSHTVKLTKLSGTNLVIDGFVITPTA